MVKVAQQQQGGTLPRLVWDPDITRFGNSNILRDGLVSIGEDHSGLPLGFNDTLMAGGPAR